MLALRPLTTATMTLAALVLTVTTWTAAPLAAQYTSPGSPTPLIATPSEEELEGQLEEARWRLGPLRLAPWVGLRDVSLVVNSSGDREDEDFTATVGAGLRAYARSGPKVIWAAHALPEYVWWQDDEDKRSLNGRYGLGLFLYFNRLTVEVSQRRNERQSFFSSEVQELTTQREDLSRLALDLELTDRVSLVGSFDRIELANEEEADVFSRLDRSEEVARLGLRYRAPGGWTFGLGYEDSRAEFAAGARNLDNQGTATYGEARYLGPRFGVLLGLANRSLEPDDDSQFRDLDEVTGSLETRWILGNRTALYLYTRRHFNYTVDLSSSTFVGERFGARLDFRLFGRSTLGFIAEAGDDVYEPLATTVLQRMDDVTSYGVEASIPLGKILRLALQVLESEYDSNDDTFDREIMTFGFSTRLGLEDVFTRLRLGDAGDTW